MRYSGTPGCRPGVINIRPASRPERYPTCFMAGKISGLLRGRKEISEFYFPVNLSLMIISMSQRDRVPERSKCKAINISGLFFFNSLASPSSALSRFFCSSKRTNRRKGVRKRQPRPVCTPATQAIKALPIKLPSTSSTFFNATYTINL